MDAEGAQILVIGAAATFPPPGPKKNWRVSGCRPSLNKTSVPKIFIGPKILLFLIIVKITVYDAFSYAVVKVFRKR
jgi:hypothetical protein